MSVLTPHTSGRGRGRSRDGATGAENLKLEGLFRVPGNQNRILDLKERVDKSGGPIDLKGVQIHVRFNGAAATRPTGGRACSCVLTAAVGAVGHAVT